ncbi:hypothetical protein CB1_000324008 [Camelus ferus]|nr:hypothetical protein CB1_000324008 [Camelus ferus]
MALTSSEDRSGVLGECEGTGNKGVPKKKRKFSSKEEPLSSGPEEAAGSKDSSSKKKKKFQNLPQEDGNGQLPRKE